MMKRLTQSALILLVLAIGCMDLKKSYMKVK